MPSFDAAAPQLHRDSPRVGEEVPSTTSAPGAVSGPSTFVSVNEYLWELCDAAGANCFTRSRRSLHNYAPSRADEGDTLRVIVVLGDEFGHRGIGNQ